MGGLFCVRGGRREKCPPRFVGGEVDALFGIMRVQWQSSAIISRHSLVVCVNSGAMWSLIRGDTGFNPTHEDKRSNQNVPRAGWRQVHTRGGHRQFRHASKPGTLTVAGSENIDIPPGTSASILKQAGLKQVEEHHEVYGGH